MNYGGQAVIEGVMMRSKNHMVTAVRLENNKIKVKRQTIPNVPFQKVLFIRGIFHLIETLKIGISSLNWSASQQLDEDEQGSSWIVSFFGTLLAIFFALFLFKFIPLFVAKISTVDNLFLFNLIDGGIKLGMFIGYIWVISRFKDIKRIFQYHGAEHKAIGCLEYKEELTVENCRKYKKEHKRCGTNFLFIVIFISIFVYLFIPLQMSFFQNLALRVLLLPIIAGIAYELIKLSGKYNNWFIDVISYPGIIIQKLTTYEPTDEQLEVGIISLKELIKLDK